MALHVPVDELTGGEPVPVRNPARGIEQAMMAYQVGPVSAVPGNGLRYLQTATSACYALYQATRYDEAGDRIAALILQAAAAPSTQAGWHLRAAVFDVAASVLARIGQRPLAWMAADRAMTAAAQSGDPLRAIAAAWRMSMILTSRGYPAEALALAGSALETVYPRSASPSDVSIRGALHLAAASAAAASYDQALASNHLADADAAADELGCDANHLGTAFGPVNVAIHKMSCAVRLGDARTAVAAGEALDPRSLPPGITGRRTQIHLDLARGYAMRRQDSAAVNMILAAEKLSPQLVRYDAATRELLEALLRREHHPSTPELRPLAHRAGVI
jgi:hypothetical protein